MLDLVQQSPAVTKAAPTLSQYKSPRAKAWRNTAVAAINAGLEQGLFTLEPTEEPHWTAIYTFDVAGIPCRAGVRAVGYGELSFQVEINPSPRRAAASYPGGRWSRDSDGYVACWLERKLSPWLQCNPVAKFRNGVLQRLVAVEVEPCGYSDWGPWVL